MPRNPTATTAIRNLLRESKRKIVRLVKNKAHQSVIEDAQRELEQYREMREMMK